MKYFVAAALAATVALGQSPRFSPLSYPSATVPSDEAEYSVQSNLADFDGDGDLDFAGLISFCFNDGQGRFTTGPAVSLFGGFAGRRAVGDLGGDFKSEFVAVGSFGFKIWGAGPTSAPADMNATLPALPPGGSNATPYLDDVDGDGDLDILLFIPIPSVLGGPDPGVFLAKNQGAFAFVAAAAIPAGTRFVPLALADLDGDGDRDLLGYDDLQPAGPNRRIAWNNGSGSYVMSSYFGASGAAHIAVTTDFTGDGLVDVVIGRGPVIPLNIYSPGATETLINLGAGAFASQADPFAEGPITLRAFDYDADGVPELLRGVRQGIVTVHHVSATGIDPAPIAQIDEIKFTGDADGDGDDDALNFDSSGVLRLRLTTPSGLVETRDAAVGELPVIPSFLYADVDGDGDLDAVGTGTLLVAGVTVSAWDVRYQTSPGKFERLAAFPPSVVDGLPTGVGWQAIAAADLDGDGAAELIFAATTSPAGAASPPVVSVQRRQPDGSFVRTAAGNCPALSRHVHVFDADADGDRDFVVVADFQPLNTPEKSRLFLNQGGLSFTTIDLGTPQHGSQIAAVDVDLDGDLDLIQANATLQFASSAATLLTNLGGGVYVESTFAPASFAASVTAGDLDLDGDVDFVLGATPYFVGPGGRIAGPPAPFINGFVGNAVLADVTGDGLPDLVASGGFCPGLGAAGFGSEEQMRPWNFQAAPTFLANNQLEALDLDGDGDLEVVNRYNRVYWNLTRHLEVGLVPGLGRTAELDVYGAANEPFALFVSSAPTAPANIAPFGTLFIEPAFALLAATGSLDGMGRGALSGAIPNNPALDGLELWWQAVHIGQARLGTVRKTTIRAL